MIWQCSECDTRNEGDCIRCVCGYELEGPVDKDIGAWEEFIKIKCIQCHEPLKIRSKVATGSGKCPVCGARFKVTRDRHNKIHIIIDSQGQPDGQSQWYVQFDGIEKGPMVPSELRQLVNSGKILPDTRIRKQGMQKTVPASMVKGLLKGSAHEHRAKSQQETAMDTPKSSSQQHRGERIVHPEFSTRWLSFYIYAYLPFSIVGSFVPTLANYDRLLEQGYRVKLNPMDFIPIVAVDIFICFIIYGLHMRRSWAWTLNWIFLGMSVLLNPLSTAKSIGAYIVAVILMVLMFFLPNFVYFKKRRVLFY